MTNPEVATKNANMNSEDLSKLLDEFTKMKLFFTKEIEEIKRCHNEELSNHKQVIDKLQTRVNVLEMKMAVNDIKLEHYEINTDNNEQYSRRHSLRLFGMEKKKRNESAGDVLETVYEEMDRLDAPMMNSRLTERIGVDVNIRMIMGSGNSQFC